MTTLTNGTSSAIVARPVGTVRNPGAEVIRQIPAVAASDKWDAKTATQRKPRPTNQAFFIGTECRPVASLVEALHENVVGVRIATNVETNDRATYSSNWYLRQYEKAYGNREAQSGAGLGIVVSQLIDGQEVRTMVALEQAISVLTGVRVPVRSKVTEMAKRTRTALELVVDADGPILDGEGQPQYAKVTRDLDPMDVVDHLPTWAELTGVIVPIGNQRYYVQDLLEVECERRIQLYAANHGGEVLAIQPIDCLQFSISENYAYGAQARQTSEGRLMTAGDIKSNSGAWHKARAGIAIGVRGGEFLAWFQFIPIARLAELICGQAPVAQFVGPRVAVGQERSALRTRAALPVAVALPAPVSDDAEGTISGGAEVSDDAPFSDSEVAAMKLEAQLLDGMDSAEQAPVAKSDEDPF